MGLGNSNSLGQVRSKSVARIAKRRGEIVRAQDFHAITGSAETGETNHNNTCGTSEAVNQTYYHSAGSADGYTTNTYFYTRKRQSSNYYLADGYYKVTHDSSTYKSIQITNGKIASLNTCR